MAATHPTPNVGKQATPNVGKCRWCAEEIPTRESAFIVSFKSTRGADFLAFTFCKLRCVVQWALLEGWPKNQ